MPENKLPINEIEEALDAAIGLVESIADAKADGEVTKLEMLKIAISNSPAIIKGVVGLDKALEQAKDLDKQELEVLASKGIKLVQAVGRVFS
jgi:hypothetical protein